MLDESARRFSPYEKRIADKLISEGRDVKSLAEEGATSRFADAEIDGVATEFKNAQPGATNATIKNEINDSVRGPGQARNIIIDARNSGLTQVEAQRGLARAKGISRAKIDSVRVIGDGFDIISTDFK